MSVRYRKSISIGPGLRLNLTKTGMGMTVGGHGVHYSVHSGNRRTTSVHLGPGLTWTKRSSGSRASIATGAGPFRSQTAVAPPAPPHPHLWQQGARALLALIRDQRLADRAALEAVAAAHREVALPARLLAGFAAAANGDLTDAATDFQAVITDPLDVAAHPFTVAYFGPCGIHLHIALADRITVDLPPSRDAARLALAEVYAHDDRVTDAIAVLDGMTHTSPVLIAVCDLYLKAERFSDIVTLTANVHNVDDSTALLLVFRGVALRELSQPEAAIAAFGEVIRFRSRAAQVRHHALAERATTYLELGRAAAARKDLTRVTTDDPAFPEAAARLAALNGPPHPAQDAPAPPPAPPPPPPAPTPPTPPAAWYPDPNGSPDLRWWDGTRWTETTAPAPS